MALSEARLGDHLVTQKEHILNKLPLIPIL